MITIYRIEPICNHSGEPVLWMLIDRDGDSIFCDESLDTVITVMEYLPEDGRPKAEDFSKLHAAQFQFASPTKRMFDRRTH